MAYLAPIHHASSARHALSLHLTSAEDVDLVVAKSNRLEIYSQNEDGLRLVSSRSVYGRITMLHKIRPADSATDHLFVGTDRFAYFTASWDQSQKQLRTEKSYVDLADTSARDAQTGDRCHIDPSESFMTIESYEGVVIVAPIIKKTKKDADAEVGTLGDPTPVRIPEMFVRASCFILTKAGDSVVAPKLALLYEDNYKHVKLKTRTIAYSPGLSGDSPMVDLEDAQTFDERLEQGMSHLLPVAAPACGVLVIGETSIVYWDGERSTKRIALNEATIFVAWTQIDAQRYVLADEYGRLYLLMLEIDAQNKVTGWKLDKLGEISKASALVYLGRGRVFVASHQGDSQVITIQPQAINVDQIIPNIAPILDFDVMDLGNRSGEGQVNEFSSGQARLVTGSGAFNDGSLRSVRSGVGLEDVGILGTMENVTDLFSLSSNASDTFDDILIVSFVDETRVFNFSVDGSVEELTDFKGLSLDCSTLWVGEAASGRIVHVTPLGVRLLDQESGMSVSEWKVPSGQAVTAVTASLSVCIVVVGGSTIAALDLAHDLRVTAERTFDGDAQVACVNLEFSKGALCAVGFWGDSEVSILAVKDLTTAFTARASTGDSSVPRDLLIADLIKGQGTMLSVAMADGQVTTYSFDKDTGALFNEKSIVLGTQQAKFHPLLRTDGLYNVFATCEQPSLIYGSEGRLTYSAITADTAVAVCPFNAQAYPGAIAVATKSELKISIIDEERSTHVQGTHVGETVRRIARSPALRAFGLGTIERTLDSGVEIVKSRFKLADEVTFKTQATYELNEDELVESVMRAELPDGQGKLAERFVVGTAYVDEDSPESIRGRLIILEVTEDRSVKEVAELSVRGACRCLAMADGMIVAALIKTVVLCSLDYTTPSTPAIVKQASYRTSTAPIDIAVTSNTAGQPVIAVADLMKSLSILTVLPPATPGGSPQLIETGRHFQTLWSTAVCHIDENKYLESDAEGNLLVLRQDVTGVTEEDRRRLTVESELCLGEVVNRIRRIDVPTMSNAVVQPRAFIATTEGSIFLFSLIAPEWLDPLIRLQTTMATAVKSLGNIPFGPYRAFRNSVREENEPFRFVDGELVESFLGVDEATQEALVKGAGLDKTVGVDKIRAVLEGLRRLR